MADDNTENALETSGHGPDSSTATRESDDLHDLIRRNIDLVNEVEAAQHKRRTWSEVVADAIAGFCGHMAFVWVHCFWFAFWLLWNGASLVPRGLKFDPPPFPQLTLVVSLEAIFLSTFILISQNRQQRLSDERTHLDLQINLLSEQENSNILTILDEIRSHLGIRSKKPEDAALREETDVRRVVKELEENVDSLGGSQNKEGES